MFVHNIYNITHNLATTNPSPYDVTYSAWIFESENKNFMNVSRYHLYKDTKQN